MRRALLLLLLLLLLHVGNSTRMTDVDERTLFCAYYALIPLSAVRTYRTCCCYSVMFSH